MKWAQKQTGFTIVELLVVIVVIAILASIAIVSYNGVTARTRDSVRLTHARQIETALYLYGEARGDLVGLNSGCGRYGAGGGWFNRGSAIDPAGPTTDYPRAIIDCLVDENVININVVDPSGDYGFSSTDPDGHYTYMKYNCNASATVAFIFIKLENQKTEDRMPTTGICEGISDSYANTARSAYDSYKMNHYIRVAL